MGLALKRTALQVAGTMQIPLTPPSERLTYWSVMHPILAPQPPPPLKHAEPVHPHRFALCAEHPQWHLATLCASSLQALARHEGRPPAALAAERPMRRCVRWPEERPRFKDPVRPTYGAVTVVPSRSAARAVRDPVAYAWAMRLLRSHRDIGLGGTQRALKRRRLRVALDPDG